MAIKKPNDDELIEDLLAPISDIYESANYKVLSIITERIKYIGRLTPTDAGRLSVLLKNQDLKQIESILSEATELSIKEIDSIVTESASYNDELATKLYEYRNIPLSTIATDSALLNVVEVAKKNMVDSVVNLSKTTGFMINGKMTDVSKTYNFAVNRAVFEVQQGLFDFNTAMRSTVKELSNSGIRTVEYDTIMPNGKPLTRRLDSAARMNISDGIRQLNMNYRETQGEQYGSDGVEISAHALCAPDHQFIQGKQYSMKEFERLQATLERPIGSLNCKHSVYPIILGVSEPVYSDSELKQFKDNSNKKVEYTTRQKDKNGNFIKKTVPKYEMSQILRKTEVEIRRLKDIKNQFEVMDDKGMIQEYNKRISDKTKYYKQIASETGLRTKMDRVNVVKSNVPVIQKPIISKNVPKKEIPVVNKQIKDSISTNKPITSMTESELKSNLRKVATEYYGSLEMKKIIGNRNPESVVNSLLSGASKTSMQRDLKSIMKKLGK